MTRILVVDDDFSDLETMKTTLASAGYIVEAATNASQALDLIEGEKFDLILLDIKMIAVKGVYLASKIRAMYLNKVKIAYVSIVPREDITEAEMASVDAFIQKPFSPDTFLRQVKKILKDQNGY